MDIFKDLKKISKNTMEKMEIRFLKNVISRPKNLKCTIHHCIGLVETVQKERSVSSKVQE